MASYIEGALKAYLGAGTAVAAICSTRIYWLRVPQTPTKPYVFFFRVSDPHQPLYFDDTGAKTKAGQARFQFTCVSESNLDAVNLQQEVMAKLREKTYGATQGFTIERIQIENMRQRVDPETLDYLCDVDAIVEYYEP